MKNKKDSNITKVGIIMTCTVFLLLLTTMVSLYYAYYHYYKKEFISFELICTEDDDSIAERDIVFWNSVEQYLDNIDGNTEDNIIQELQNTGIEESPDYMLLASYGSPLESVYYHNDPYDYYLHRTYQGNKIEKKVYYYKMEKVNHSFQWE